ncbi:predicted protein [Nematostella vectensis]|uniref:Lipoxygenase domain-containing protein n=1 Tax=Nematostella vectensis TaxID=45351 RepID=A7SSW5_NEMVE|nr:predicted protein [Nematostella vectensis]|eukprot:XP_001625310.1 predicted protein [Nematostella vectensis]
MPIAIQLFQEKSANNPVRMSFNNPVFLPGDPWYTWSLAKMWFNHAEAQYHRACALIGFTHLVIESIAIATHRQLSPSHPIFRLLAPFIRDVIAINSFEVNELLAPGSWLDSSTSLGSKGIVDLLQVRKERLEPHNGGFQKCPLPLKKDTGHVKSFGKTCIYVCKNKFSSAISAVQIFSH